MELSFLKHTKSILSILLLVGIFGCFRPPEFPETPSISFKNITFDEVVEVVGTSGIEIKTGVLSLSFNVTDGDGDIGLSGGEGIPDFFFVTNESGNIVQYGDRPDIDPPFTCVDYIREAAEDENGIDYNQDGDVTDTLRVELNEDRFNFFIDFYVKKNGVYEELDFRRIPESANGETLCGEVPFDGRIPCLSTEDSPCNDIDTNPGPVEGVVTYDMKSGTFLPVFRTDTIKVSFQMQDRAFHRSNIVESPEFTLQGIRVKGNG